MISSDYTVDKTAWGDGVWMNEPDRVDFVFAGLACFALRHPEHGQWCGYVGVPREHPLYGKAYQDVDLEAHGGLTYSGACDGRRICHVPAPGMPDDVWWFGFDCGHAWDLSPGMRARLRKFGEEARAAGSPFAHAFEEHDYERMEVYRALPYVREEIEHLAIQLASMLPSHALPAPAVVNA